MSWPELEEAHVAVASEENGNPRCSKGWTSLKLGDKGQCGDGSLNMVVDGD